MIISDKDYEILKAVGHYEYLNSKQLVRLGVSHSITYLQKRLKRMTENSKPLLKALDFGVIPTIGRLPRLFCLTSLGVEALKETDIDPENIRSPRNAALFRHDYWHRIYTIDVMITAEQWAEKNGTALFDHKFYYGRGKKSRQGGIHSASYVSWIDQNNQLQSIVPDVVFKAEDSEAKTRLFAFELTNCTDWQTDKKKIAAYMDAMKHTAIEETFNYPDLARVLFVYENKNALERFKKWAASCPDFEGFENRFYAKSLEQIMIRGFSPTWSVLGYSGKVHHL